jgi:hypothetical protein
LRGDITSAIFGSGRCHIGITMRWEAFPETNNGSLRYFESVARHGFDP